MSFSSISPTILKLPYERNTTVYSPFEFEVIEIGVIPSALPSVCSTSFTPFTPLPAFPLDVPKFADSSIIESRRFFDAGLMSISELRDTLVLKEGGVTFKQVAKFAGRTLNTFCQNWAYQQQFTVLFKGIDKQVYKTPISLKDYVEAISQQCDISYARGECTPIDKKGKIFSFILQPPLVKLDRNGKGIEIWRQVDKQNYVVDLRRAPSRPESRERLRQEMMAAATQQVQLVEDRKNG